MFFLTDRCTICTEAVYTVLFKIPILDTANACDEIKIYKRNQTTILIYLRHKNSYHCLFSEGQMGHPLPFQDWQNWLHK